MQTDMSTIENGVVLLYAPVNFFACVHKAFEYLLYGTLLQDLAVQLDNVSRQVILAHIWQRLGPILVRYPVCTIFALRCWTSGFGFLLLDDLDAAVIEFVARLEQLCWKPLTRKPLVDGVIRLKLVDQGQQLPFLPAWFSSPPQWKN